MLSVIIITKNEEANIRRCLESIRFADEVIILDSGSTDNTIVIAKEFTEKVYSTDWQGYGVQKQRALLKATSDWVLNLDADESVSPELQNEIIEAINSDVADAYRIPIQMVFYKKPLKYSGSPKRHIRLFKRKNAAYSTDIVHEKIVVPSTAVVGRLKNPIMHHSFKDVHHVLYKLNKYSSYSAKIRIESKKSIGMAKILLSTAWMFFRSYFLQRGFLDGQPGFLFAVFNAQGTFYRGIKQIYKDKEISNLPKLSSSEDELCN